jgi:hypothetical protein
MDYEVTLQPAVMKNGVKYKIIQITDIAIHTAKKTPTSSITRKFQEAFTNDKPDRIYSKIEKPTISENGAFTLDLLKTDPDFVKMVQEEELKGFKVMIALPKNGIPIFAGKDTVEFINSKNGKRIIRGLAKEKDKE